jgi:hypothetical protein
MSLRTIRLSAALVLAGFAFVAAPPAPALADGIVAKRVTHHPRHVVVKERVRTVHHVVRKIVYVPQYYTTSCGGCGSAHVAPQHYIGGTYIPYRHIAPQPYYYGTSCGGCTSHYHHRHGGFIAALHSHFTAHVQPAQYSAEENEGEQAPAYVAPRRHRFHTLKTRS